MTATSTLAPAAVNVRIENSAGWTSMRLAFAFVDIFSLYRPDAGTGTGLASRSSLPWDP